MLFARLHIHFITVLSNPHKHPFTVPHHVLHQLPSAQGLNKPSSAVCWAFHTPSLPLLNHTHTHTHRASQLLNFDILSQLSKWYTVLTHHAREVRGRQEGMHSSPCQHHPLKNVCKQRQKQHFFSVFLMQFSVVQACLCVLVCIFCFNVVISRAWFLCTNIYTIYIYQVKCTLGCVCVFLVLMNIQQMV